MKILGQRDGATTAVQPLSFIGRVKTGRVVPVISDEAIFDLLMGGYQAFTQSYADYINYPMPDKGNMVKMTKFHKLAQQNRADQDNQEKKNFTNEDLKSDYLLLVKSYIYQKASREGVDQETLDAAETQVNSKAVSAFAGLLGYPRFDQGTDDPLLVLASLPIKIYLTTSPYTFLEEALCKYNKAPRTEVCRWRKELDSIDSVIDDAYKPSAEKPLVYHLHGLDLYPDSLVLTEDDYLEFLVNICQGQGNDAIDRIHALVRKALSDDLILLGYSLNSWAFRCLYAGLIKPNSKAEDRGVCCLQLMPNGAEKSYLQDYAQREAKFEVFWGDLHSYAQTLRVL